MTSIFKKRTTGFTFTWQDLSPCRCAIKKLYVNYLWCILIGKPSYLPFTLTKKICCRKVIKSNSPNNRPLVAPTSALPAKKEFLHYFFSVLLAWSFTFSINLMFYLFVFWCREFLHYFFYVLLTWSFTFSINLMFLFVCFLMHFKIIIKPLHVLSPLILDDKSVFN